MFLLSARGMTAMRRAATSTMSTMRACALPGIRTPARTAAQPHTRRGDLSASRTISRSLSSSATPTALAAQKDPSREGRDPALAIASLSSCKAVLFDVDSTVSTEEGIDVLAASLGADKARAVEEWTNRAMGGDVTFQEAIRARLSILEPSRSDVESLVKSHDFPLTDGITELIAALAARGKEVYFVSGGLLPLVLPVAAKAGIPPEKVFAIPLLFDEGGAGAYVGFGEDAPTARTGGKCDVARIVSERVGGGVVMVGDGVTDMEAKPPALATIGFGANAVREAVVERADWFVRSAREITEALEEEEE